MENRKMFITVDPAIESIIGYTGPDLSCLIEDEWNEIELERGVDYYEC